MKNKNFLGESQDLLSNIENDEDLVINYDDTIKAKRPNKQATAAIKNNSHTFDSGIYYFIAIVASLLFICS